jgi:hypothetical protein
VKYSQHNQPISLDAILEDVGHVKDLQHDLPVFLAPGDRMTEPGCSPSTLTFSTISRATTRASAG